MTTKSITPGQRKQIVRVCEDAATKAATEAIENALLTSELAQRILAEGDKLQAELRSVIERFIYRVSINLRQEEDRAALNTIFTLISDGRSVQQLITAPEAKGCVVDDRAKVIMSEPEFAQKLTSGITYQLVGIRGDEFTDEQRTTVGIYAEGSRRRYRKPPAFLAALLREQFTQDQLGYPYVAVMHEPISVPNRGPCVLELNRFGRRDWLCAWHAHPGNRWGAKILFLFLAPQE